MQRLASTLKSLGFALLLATAPLCAQEVELAESHPTIYTVVPGDTLWDISARFLAKPWLWPEVWHVNPQIENPHLIFPGDRIGLIYVDGDPRLTVMRGKRQVKLSPNIRYTPMSEAIPVLPLDVIRPFLTEPHVLEEDEHEELPYVLQLADEHVIGGSGDRMYVMGTDAPLDTKFSVVRPGGPYIDPDTEEVLGYEALFIGSSVLKRLPAPEGPSTHLMIAAEVEVNKGDRLIQQREESILEDFKPQAPSTDVSGRILSVLNGVSNISQYQVVVINKGAREGLEPGHVLIVDEAGKLVSDSVQRGFNKKVMLPDEEAGVMMIFRTFEKVSFGLIMEATRAMHVNDKVRTP